jgi:hypothetical protein
MSWTRIQSVAQLAGIGVDTKLQRYPQMIYMPEELTNSNNGKVYQVTKVENGTVFFKFAGVQGMQEMVESTYPQTLRLSDFKAGVWYMKA